LDTCVNLGADFIQQIKSTIFEWIHLADFHPKQLTLHSIAFYQVHTGPRNWIESLVWA